MDIARIDYWATSGGSVLHRASVLSKVLATAAVVAAVIVGSRLMLLAPLYLAVIVTVRAAGLPPLRVILISLLPGLFALLYAISRAGEGLSVSLMILLKAFTAASAMILLLSTTPYTDVLGLVGRVLPRALRDGLFMTYRSFFILLRLMDNLIRAARLRGGLRPGRFIGNARSVGSGVGILFIHAYDESQRLYDVMSIRGYAGRLCARRSYGAVSLNDLPYLLVAVLFLGCSLYAARMGKEAGLVFPAAVLLVYAAVMEALRFWKR